MPDVSQRETMNASGDNVNPWAKLILQVGVPSTIALYLVWLLGGQVIGELRAQTTMMNEHATNTAAIAESVKEQRDSTDVVAELLKQLCVQQAKTPTDRSACFNASLRSNLARPVR